MHIDVQRALNYLLMVLAISGGIAFGALAGRLLDLSLEGESPVLSLPLKRQSSVRPLQEQDFQIILSRNLFNSAAAGDGVEQVDLSTAALTQSVDIKTAANLVDLSLVGTVVAGSESLALIRNGQKTGIYRLGDEISPRVKLEQVKRKMVIIVDHGNERELPLLEQKGPRPQLIDKARTNGSSQNDGIVALNDGRWQISRAVANQARANLNSLLQTARVVPEIKNGQTIGFKLVELQRGSLLEKIGLQVGDLIVEINQSN